MIGTRLSSLRQMHGVSQNVLASRLGISQTQVCRIERGERYPSLRYILRFCRALRLPPNEVLFDEVCVVDLPGEDPSCPGGVGPGGKTVGDGARLEPLSR